MALVSVTLPEGVDLIMNGEVHAAGSTIVYATAAPLLKLDIDRVRAVDTGGDWLTPNEA